MYGTAILAINKSGLPDADIRIATVLLAYLDATGEAPTPNIIAEHVCAPVDYVTDRLMEIYCQHGECLPDAAFIDLPLELAPGPKLIEIISEIARELG